MAKCARFAEMARMHASARCLRSQFTVSPFRRSSSIRFNFDGIFCGQTFLAPAVCRLRFADRVLLRLRRPPRPAARDGFISESLAIRNELNKNAAASMHTNEF